jgi:FkbM family methyltransferase
MNNQSSDHRSFRHYTTKQRVVAWISQNLFDNITYTVRNGLLKGMRRRGGLGWLPEFLMVSTRTPEQSFWKNQDLKDLVIYDIGAYIGLLTLFFARNGRQVISYEPNTRNHARLVDNLRLNGLKNVLVRQVGVGSKPGVATMVASPLMLGGASMEGDVVAGTLNSNLHVLSEQVFITTLDGDIQEKALPKPDLVKIDVEGFELAVLVGARNTLLAHHPQLFLEMHGETMSLKQKNAAEIVAYLNELGYTEIRHVESGARINADNSSGAARGHLYCQ